MPRFYFHLTGGPEGVSPDESGVVLPDSEAAYLEAFHAARDMAQEWLREGRNPRRYAFEVRNDAGELVLELPFSEVLDHQAGRRPAKLSRSVRTAKEQGERMMRLTADVTRQIKMAQENLRQSQELLQRFGKSTNG
ncbi:hypothetical protein HPT29_011265 [Microvirga terrae]|uniref:DUF6894 domain-containing protein n=1 Tax=Microvirga terrae TaxID=2740529 RepID=A0ABY5S071_9HYPH|nr:MULTISPECIES: hypothetical protein [Microvirga]MBQ0820062.1 hypothetical protein [Microvirga sp. HBU67558]UVF21654.1 hypothetical protein HPT29_011265 [Microvirga terrae]